MLINCSNDILSSTDPNSSGTYVVWDAPVVIENHEYTIETTPPAGHFPVGNTTVTIFVEDSAGLNDSCQFIVTVIGMSRCIGN